MLWCLLSWAMIWYAKLKYQKHGMLSHSFPLPFSGQLQSRRSCKVIVFAYVVINSASWKLLAKVNIVIGLSLTK